MPRLRPGKDQALPTAETPPRLEEIHRASSESSGAARNPPDGDRGFASIATLAAGAVIVAVGMTAVLAVTVTIARHQAQTAADLGALAGAVRAELLPDQACAAARAIVEANGAELQSCRVDGVDVTVVAAVEIRNGPAGLGPAVATARAGPLDPGQE